jgi:hypothetical protein
MRRTTCDERRSTAAHKVAHGPYERLTDVEAASIPAVCAAFAELDA